MSSPVRDTRAQATAAPTVNVGARAVHVCHLETLDDFEACVALQKAIWGADFDAMVPRDIGRIYPAHVRGAFCTALRLAREALLPFREPCADVGALGLGEELYERLATIVAFGEVRQTPERKREISFRGLHVREELADELDVGFRFGAQPQLRAHDAQEARIELRHERMHRFRCDLDGLLYLSTF